MGVDFCHRFYDYNHCYSFLMQLHRLLVQYGVSLEYKRIFTVRYGGFNGEQFYVRKGICKEEQFEPTTIKVLEEAPVE